MYLWSIPLTNPPTNSRRDNTPPTFSVTNSNINTMANFNFEFKTQQENDLIENSWTLQEVKQQLGLASIELQRSKSGEGYRALFTKPDGTFKWMPVSKEMNPEDFHLAKLVKFKNPQAGSDGYVIVRHNGNSLASI